MYVADLVNDGGIPFIMVKRALVTRNEGIQYHSELMRADELESIEANIDREFAEVVYRQNLMQSKLTKDRDVDLEIEVGEDDPVQ